MIDVIIFLADPFGLKRTTYSTDAIIGVLLCLHTQRGTHAVIGWLLFKQSYDFTPIF